MGNTWMFVKSHPSLRKVSDPANDEEVAWWFFYWRKFYCCKYI